MSQPTSFYAPAQDAPNCPRPQPAPSPTPFPKIPNLTHNQIQSLNHNHTHHNPTKPTNPSSPSLNQLKLHQLRTSSTSLALPESHISYVQSIYDNPFLTTDECHHEIEYALEMMEADRQLRHNVPAAEEPREGKRTMTDPCSLAHKRNMQSQFENENSTSAVGSSSAMRKGKGKERAVTDPIPPSFPSREREKGTQPGRITRMDMNPNMRGDPLPSRSHVPFVSSSSYRAADVCTRRVDSDLSGSQQGQSFEDEGYRMGSLDEPQEEVGGMWVTKPKSIFTRAKGAILEKIGKVKIVGDDDEYREGNHNNGESSKAAGKRKKKLEKERQKLKEQTIEAHEMRMKQLVVEMRSAEQGRKRNSVFEEMMQLTKTISNLMKE